ncbi:MAG: HAD family hydrolase [Merismopedia sp. SIO2A8]|nr:HAD family hydrolase [Merismopedia sp. SIO2A8]
MVVTFSPDILALDFDGVICDGLIEYFQTAWQAYCQIWNLSDLTPPDGLAEQFYGLRPVIETGWEMPVLLRSLLLNTSSTDIFQDWPTIARAQMSADGIEKKALADAVDGCRDRWIQSDLDHWLAQHRFYPGVLETLTQFLNSHTHTVIISTKEGRFIHRLLQQQGIDMPRELIYGKEVKRPKYETLRLVIEDVIQQGKSQVSSDLAMENTVASQHSRVMFVEDRLKALQAVTTQSDLKSVQLFLADWGYNTEGDRTLAKEGDRIQLLSLEQFTGV